MHEPHACIANCLYGYVGIDSWTTRYDDGVNLYLHKEQKLNASHAVFIIFSKWL